MNKLLPIAIAGALTSTAALQAQNYPTSLVINTEQTEHVIPLNAISKITFSNGKMMLEQDTSAPERGNYPGSLALNAILRCYFSAQKAPTAVQPIPVIPSALVAYRTGNLLRIAGLEAHRSYRLSLLAVDGSVLYSAPAFMAYEAIEIGHLPNGIYLVRIEDQSIKFIKEN